VLYLHAAEPEMELPTYERVEETNTWMKRNWAPGEDNTGTELLKRGGRELQERVQKLIIQIWNKNKCLKIGAWDLFFHHF